MADDELTYASSGVDIAASKAATSALVEAVGTEIGGYAGLLDIGDRYLALSTDGVGTKLLVADAVGDLSTVGVDCIAMNVNDMVASGVNPVGFVDYLAMETPDDNLAAEIGRGLAAGAEMAGIDLVGGETAVMPEVVMGVDLAGACVGLARKEEVFDGEATPGDVLVGWPSSGVHSNGLTLAREAITQTYEYTDDMPDGEGSIGRTLLEPTRIYTELLEPMREAGVNGAAHITGGGWTNLHRLGDHRYDVDDPHPSPPIFGVIQSSGEIADVEMYRTFNMGTGFVAALPPENTDRLIAATDGRVIGHVTSGQGITVSGIEI